MNIGKAAGACRRNGGLTLLELLVVLVILAIMATLAVSALQPRVESARLQQTRTSLEEIAKAVAGARGSRQSDGSPLISGFVADVGRLPRWQATGGLLASRQQPAEPDGLRLRELWELESPLATEFPFQFRRGPTAPVDYSDIQIPCGWRGPYLQLAPGQDQLLDAWGRPFEPELSEQGSLEGLRTQPINQLEQPLEVHWRTALVSVTGTLNFGQSLPSDVRVVLLAPAAENSPATLEVVADEDEELTTFTFSRVPIGLRAICIDVNGQRALTKYIQVPHEGLTLLFDLSDRLPSEQ